MIWVAVMWVSAGVLLAVPKYRLPAVVFWVLVATVVVSATAVLWLLTGSAHA